LLFVTIATALGRYYAHGKSKHANVTTLRSSYVIGSEFRPSEVCDVRVAFSLLKGFKFSSIFLRHVLAQASGDLDAEKYDHRPTPPLPPSHSEASNAGGGFKESRYSTNILPNVADDTR